MAFTILHFSDTHEIARFEHWHALLDKRIVGFMNNRLLRRTGHGFHNAVISAALDYILGAKPDCVVFSGDATSCGQAGEFRTALLRFKPLLESSIPFIYTPGNHDSYVRDRACVKAAREFCGAMNRGKFFPEDFPFAKDFGKFRLLAVNCARPMAPFLSCGYMDAKTAAFLKTEAERHAAADGDGGKRNPLLCAGHFPLIDPHPVSHSLHLLYGAKQAARLLRNGKIDLSLCGHIHKPYAILHGRGRGEISAGSLTASGVVSKIVYDDAADLFSLERVDIAKKLVRDE